MISKFEIVFVTSNYSTMRVIDAGTNIDEMYAGLKEEFMAEAQTDDFWIDDMWTTDSDVEADWMKLIAPGGLIDRDMLEKVFEEGEEFIIRIKFLSDSGYDITEERLDGVYIYDAGSENWI